MAVVRSQLQHASSVWSPHHSQDVEKLESVQIRATKMLPGFRTKSYEDRLITLNLPTLKFRRLRVIWSMSTKSWAESTSEVYVRNSEPKLKLLVKKAETRWHCTRRDATLISGNTVSPTELYLSGTHCRTKLCNQKQLTNSSEESTMLGGTRRWSSTTKKSWVRWELHVENEWWVAMVAFDTAKFYPKMKDVRKRRCNERLNEVPLEPLKV